MAQSSKASGTPGTRREPRKCGGYGGLHFLSHAFCLGIAQTYLSEISAFRDKWWKFMATSQAVFGVTRVPAH